MVVGAGFLQNLGIGGVTTKPEYEPKITAPEKVL